MTDTTNHVLADRAEYLVATAGRAPSVHNTQPWRFRFDGPAVELYCDPRRRLRIDPSGREMVISCGAALFGLRLAVRSLGYLPVVAVLPDPARPRLLARVTAGAAEPVTAAEREMLRAMPHRHTHRGAFGPGPLPDGLLSGLQDDARAEGVTLAIVGGAAYRRLADIAGSAHRGLGPDLLDRAESRRWSRSPASTARDGIPAFAFPSASRRAAGRLPQRDFDLGRGIGLLADGGPPPAATAVLLTPEDEPTDWLWAGQALHRLLVHAASKWVFASLHTQLLEIDSLRALVRDRLELAGAPQLLLQLGMCDTTHPTGRRPAPELIEPEH